MVFVAGAGALLFVFLMVMSSLQEQFLFYPEVLPDDYTFRFPQPFEEVVLAPEDGVRLHALLFSTDEARGIVVYFHGNAGSLRSWGEIAGDMVSRGYAVLVTDYRGYGKSRGPRSERALLDDALRWYDYAAERFPEASIVPYGRSLGTAPAAFIAAEREPRHLVLETPYYSMADLAKHWFPWFPSGMIAYPLRTHSYLARVRCPVTLLHGTDDEVVPYESSLRLQRLLKPDDRFISVPGGHHNDLSLFPQYYAMLDAVLTEPMDGRGGI